MVDRRENSDLGAPLRRLAAALDYIAGESGAWPLTTDVGQLARSVRNYLLPRFEDRSRAMTVVFAGPTGAGKSTLLNSIAGIDVSTTGALRPTTQNPVALVAAEHLDDHQTIDGVACRTVIGEAPILKTLTLVDTPDVDSTETQHRVVAETLVDHADIVVFVTSALRYADAVPWQLLRRAHARGTEVISVLNRVSPATSGARVDFRSRLADAGLDDDLVSVPEHHMARGAERLPALAVRSLRKRLAAATTTSETRSVDTLQRVLAATLAQVGTLIDEIEQHVERREEFEDELSLDLVGELETIALHGVTAGLHEELGDDDSPRRVARWLRRNRRRPEEAPDLEVRLADRITGLVRGETRRLVEGYQLWPGHVKVSAAVDEHLETALGPAVTGWLLFVDRIAEQRPGRQWSAASALVESACSGLVTSEAVAILGDEAGALVERARRELVGRLEVIGSGLAAALADLAYPRFGGAHLEELRSAHGALVSRLAPVHA